MRMFIGIFLSSAVALCLAVASGKAETAADFYQKKTITVVIGYPAGGGYDLTARLLIRHMPRQIPGQPTMIPQNMPGAGSQRVANFLYAAAPSDGTSFGIVGGYIPFVPLWDSKGIKYDPTKFNWLGSLDRWNGLALVWHTAPATTFADSLKKEVLIGATGSTDIGAIYPKVMNALVGTKFKIVSGYQGTPDLNLAIERGEVHGRFGLCWECLKAERPAWVAGKKVAVLFMLGIHKTPETETVPELKGLPQVTDLAKSEEDREIMKIVFGGQEMARPFLAPPNVPAVRLAVLREAFEKTSRDPAFLADAKHENIPINIATWQELDQLVKDVYSIPKPTVERAARIINAQ